jgi:hypothetical protein
MVKQPLPSLSMYIITAKLLTHIEASVIQAFGEKRAKAGMQEGIKNFGYARTKKISDQATTEGEKHVLANYLPDNVDVSEADGDTHTIYALMAKLFAQVSKVFVDEYGEDGQDAIREGVRTFGEARGEGIADRAKHMGEDTTIEHYLSNYDMGRSDLFEFESIFKPENIEQTFTKCPFGQQWADDDMHEYGILYCQMIDPAVAKGYNPDFEVEHDKYVLKEGVCHFNFKLAEKKVIQND